MPLSRDLLSSLRALSFALIFFRRFLQLRLRHARCSLHQLPDRIQHDEPHRSLRFCGLVQQRKILRQPARWWHRMRLNVVRGFQADVPEPLKLLHPWRDFR